MENTTIRAILPQGRLLALRLRQGGAEGGRHVEPLPRGGGEASGAAPLRRAARLADRHSRLDLAA